VTRTTATIGAVTAVCGVLTAVTAVAIVAGWRTDPWTETLFLLGAAISIAATGWFVIAFAVAASLRAAAFFVAPEQPPGLTRINSILEQRRAEQQAAVAARQANEPPAAEIVVALRTITGHGRC
jgi:hypothetical protein